jgi:energy-coupling factor transporter ATP-binding protein EcfA2
MPKQSDSKIITVVGLRGSGKSTLTRILAEPYAKRVIFDITEEWNDSQFRYVHNFKEFAAVYREIFTEETYTIIVRFEFGLSDDIIHQETDQIISLLYKAGKDTELESLIVFEEAHNYFPNHTLSPLMRSLLTQGRHAHINIIANTQRAASISKLLISQSAEVYMGQQFESNDINYLRETCGEIAEEASQLKKLEFIFFPVGDKENIALVDLTDYYSTKQ